MAGMAIDGLASGLDTTALINQLMQVESNPQTLLKAKQATTTTLVSALQGLNTRVASLAEAATKVVDPKSWDAFTASSSSDAVVATATSTASPSSLSFTVANLASTQTSVSDKVTDLAGLLGSPPPLTLTIATGTGDAAAATVVDLAEVTDLAGLADAINASKAGVSASIVKVSDTESRLQLTSSTTGAAGAFDLHKGTVALEDVKAGTAPAAFIARSGAITEAKDAKIVLWAGTSAAQDVTSATNTFSGVLTGVDLTVSKVTAAGDPPVTVTVGRDDAALKKMASGLVGALGVVFSEISTRSATTTKTGDDGRTVVTGGVFSADSAVRSLQRQLQDAASYPVDGSSPSEAGIVIGRDGTFTFDEEKFSAALAKDPAKVQAIITGLAERIATVGKNTSDKIDGSLTQKITSQQGMVRSLGDQISQWDNRLELRRAGLVQTYAALEASLSSMQSQSSWLAGQLASLPTWN